MLKNGKLKIVADENIPQVVEPFSALGEVVTVDGRHLHNAQLLDADVLLVRSVTQVNEQLLKETAVRFVATATIGVDHLDIEYLDKKAIQWANSPGCNANSVVDYVFSVFCEQQGILEGLFSGSRVGIIGMGNVGSCLYRRLGALGVSCRAYDPLLDKSQYSILGGLDEVLAADIICCHAPLTTVGEYPSHHLLNLERLRQLKKGALIVNAGRGEVIDGQDLLAVITERPDLKVVLDVWEHEPAIDLELLKKVALATPHIAGYSYDGKLTGTLMIYEACRRFLALHDSRTDRPVLDGGLLALEINCRDSVLEGVREAISQVYSVARDDRLFRQALQDKDAPERATAFDYFRKTYAIRREFSCYKISRSEELSLPLQSALAGLGFVI